MFIPEVLTAFSVRLDEFLIVPDQDLQAGHCEDA